MGSSTARLSAKPSVPRFKELHRIKVLRQYALLDTAPEQEFDDLAAMAAHVCGTPIALISLVDQDRQWFKAKVGLDLPETPREQSFCTHALNQPEMFVVPDTHADERFINNPLVTGAPGIRFYAGAPLISPKEATLGTLCVIDRVPRQLTSAQEWVMQSLASRVMNRLEQRRIRTTQKRPGVHTLTLDELRSLVCSSPYRSAMWGRLASFLASPILSGEFSHVYVDGEFISTQPYPREIDIVLQTREPYGPAGFAVIKRYLDLDLEKIYKLHSVRLSFWMEKTPADTSLYRSLMRNAPPLKNPYGADPAHDDGTLRVDLLNPDIIPQFHDALDPFRV